MTHSPAELSAILERHGIRANRALGQNFVIDPNTVRRIARLSGASEGTPVVEIGAGLGSLTLALVELGASVVAIETDRGLVRALREIVEPRGVKVVEADAREADWESLLRGHDSWHLVANLPYNIATPLIIDLLRKVHPISSMLVMVQREAGERLVASAGDPAVGIPSMLVAYYAKATIVGRVPATVFLPKPRVDSVLVRIERLAQPPVSQPLTAMEPLIRAAYGQRRKMLRRSLADLIDANGFARAEVNPTDRPETLDLAAWARLAAGLATVEGANPDP